MTDNHNQPEITGKDQSPDVNYWRSLEELYKEPKSLEAKQHEFKEGVTDEFNPSKLSGLSRRKFLALIGASAALAGAGCADYRDKGEIVPYNNKPEEITPGKANYYASTCTACSEACGILIKTREGRPIKVDGNPDHPVSAGKICSKGQASILGLYDPERFQKPLVKNGMMGFNEADWQKIDSEITAVLAQAGSKEIAVVAKKIFSPTTKKVLDEFARKYPTTKIYSYEVFNEGIRNSAWQKCYGTSKFPLLKWNEAKVIVALDSDFLGSDGHRVETARLYSEGRDVNNLDKFNRLYVVESNLSLTGINADYRLRLSPAVQYEFVLSLLNEIGRKGVAGVPSFLSNYSLKTFIEKNTLPADAVNHLVSDLLSNRGKSIVYAGRMLPEKTHIAVNLLNDLLGNKTLYKDDSSEVDLMPLSSNTDWQMLINSLNSGSVAAVIHFDSNPVFHLPSDLNYAESIQKAGTVISLSTSENESTVVSQYVLPINHNFEAWGDAQTRTGFYSLQQPVISPIYKTRQKEAVLLTWIDGKSSSYSEELFHSYLLANWEKDLYPPVDSRLSFKQFWPAVLHDGVVTTQKINSSVGSFNLSAFSGLGSDSSSGFTIVIKESMTLGDGSMANNGWLQEIPHPVSKVTWDNYASVSQSTADKLGAKMNDKIEININGRKLTVPVYIQPGAADNVITVESGYGRSAAGTIGTGTGFNSLALLAKDGGISPWIYNTDSVSKTGDVYKIVTTQEHHSFDNEQLKDLHLKRAIIQEGTVNKYKKDPHFLHEKEHELESVYDPHPYTGMKWGMSIDLNKCTGCAECIVSCVAENNIPVVGKEQVDKGREMQWLRIDRYFSGSVEDPKVSVQPMLCQHCDQAPCENVCPVVATNHSPDGLNQMVYNRCVGTRYCSNNCPYKVRRFNYFNFRDHFNNNFQEQDIFNLVYNPEVTVRSRGVMEKCTFCIQRISEAKSDAVKENRVLKGSDVKTACQEACGTNAIKFGNINDADSEFYKYRNHELGYYVLEELNVKPNVTYIAKLRNTHSEEV
ncbi:MAG: TAT-variant-translocated molybdopterin oxidoreductase [Ignavibacteriales bacterium]|nr:MAG: TAT-variant-translocated molybdopterin oxidoreductase [Ignavibacteriales bacterium]